MQSLTCPSLGHRMRDKEIRAAVFSKVLKNYQSAQDTLIVEELGVEHGDHRVDIAVINGSLHGYELKSQADNLLRLPAQAGAYSRTFDKMTLVVDESHYEKAFKIVPSWWGIKVASSNSRGNIKFHIAQPVKVNPDVSMFAMTHLLWRDEAIHLLQDFSIEKKALSQNRAFLYRLLVELVEPSLLRRRIRETLRCRPNWRGHLQPL